MSFMGILCATVLCAYSFHLCEGFTHFIRRNNPYFGTISSVNNDKLFLHPNEVDQGKEDAKNERRAKLKVLCLHGYCSSAEVFQLQIQHLCRSCADIADFTFLDGAMEFTLKNAASSPEATSAAKIKRKRSKRIWWRSEESSLESPNGVTYVGMKQSVQYIYDFIKKYGGLDAILGHSQGT